MTDDPLDESLALVADGLRRRTIESLRVADTGEIAVVELVDMLHSTEPITVSGGTSDRREIHLQLVHTHLPTLADHGIVEFDRERGVVRYRPDERIETLLDVIGELVARPTH